MQNTTATKEIGFSYNWNNKLSCRAFTTIRLHNPEKYRVGQQYDILLTGKKIMDGKVIEIKDFYLHDLNEFMAYVDTGYCKAECLNILKKMYRHLNIEKQKFSFILIERVVKK